MPEFVSLPGGVCAPKGFLAAGIHCGLRKEKKDLALIFSPTVCVAAGVTTQNKVKAAPVTLTVEHLKVGKIQGIVCNSGNANACTPDGEEKAQAMCQLVADQLGIAPTSLLVGSTGVIGQSLPIEPIAAGVKELVEQLSDQGSNDCALAIMTTDLTKKELAVGFEIGGVPCVMGGVSKGSGMIHPNMATMLGFVTTDVVISKELLQKALSAVTLDTFNMVSVDGDTSTNDMVLVLANGQAGNPTVETEEDYQSFYSALSHLATYLAKSIAADGEGATKLLTCLVNGAADTATARVLAKSVIGSSLVKSAMFGEDANWGRVLCALGYAEVPFDPETTDITFVSEFGVLAVCKEGKQLAFSEELAKKVLAASEIAIEISVGTGGGSATAWGCDLTYDYVKINGDYRS